MSVTAERTKVCCHCKEDLPVSQFQRAKQNRDGLRGACRQCMKRWQSSYYKRTRTKRLKDAKGYYQSNRERKLRYSKEWAARNPEWIKEYRLQRQYGMSSADYDELLSQQDGVCAICGKDSSGERYDSLAVDHCHETGEVRGLLCQHCNRGLGFLGDNLESLEKAVEYLQRFAESQVATSE